MNNAVQTAYYLLMLCAVGGFAINDIKTKRVPNKALVWFSPAALASPVINALANDLTGAGAFVLPVLSSIFGAALGMGVLMAAALISKKGCGVGGGDIKLAAVLGFIYGAADIIGILLIASLSALLVGLAQMKKADNQNQNIAFVPFIAAGCFIITLIGFI